MTASLKGAEHGSTNHWLMTHCCCLWLHCLQPGAGSHLTEPLCCPVDVLFGDRPSQKIHGTVQYAYLASIRGLSPDAVVTRHDFLTSVAVKARVRLAAERLII